MTSLAARGGSFLTTAFTLGLMDTSELGSTPPFLAGAAGATAFV
jgi:hypothetical protein